MKSSFMFSMFAESSRNLLNSDEKIGDRCMGNSFASSFGVSGRSIGIGGDIDLRIFVCRLVGESNRSVSIVEVLYSSHPSVTLQFLSHRHVRRDRKSVV